MSRNILPCFVNLPPESLLCYKTQSSGYLLLCNRSPSDTSWLKTVIVLTLICNLGRIQQKRLVSAPCGGTWGNQLGLEDPLLRWLTHGAGKLLSALAWELSYLSTSPWGCLSFLLTAWELGAKLQQSKGQELGATSLLRLGPRSWHIITSVTFYCQARSPPRSKRESS